MATPLARIENIPAKRVLILRLGRLGDTIMATPAIDLALEAFGENTAIDFAAGPGASSAILRLDRRIDTVYPIRHRKLPCPLHPVKKHLKNRSKNDAYDLVINLETGSACDDFYRFIRTREFIGRPVMDPHHVAGRHSVDTEKSIYASRLGPESTAAAEPRLDIPIPQDTGPMTGADYVVLNPSFFGILKQDYRANRGWPLEYWAELIDIIRSRTPLSVAINATVQDRSLLEPLTEVQGVHSLAGSSLQQLAAALSGARCTVSVDTGTMHLSAALGTPTVALFGPTIPGLTGPYTRTTPVRLLASGVSCQPCRGQSEEKSCRFARCMQELKPEQVFQSMQSLRIW